MMNARRGQQRLLLTLIVLASIASYAGNLDCYFIKDDLNIGFLTGGGNEFHWESWFRNLFWPTDNTVGGDFFRPATCLTWVPDYLIFGPDPVGFHIWNFFFHALNGVLIFLLVNRLTRQRNSLAGFFAGLLFVLYPLHLEAVLWMTQRFVLMGLAFSLLALLFYDIWLHRRRRRYLVLAWVSVALACLSKEPGVTLPGPLLFMALFMGPGRPRKERMRDGLSVVLTGAAILAVYFALRFAVFGRLFGAGYVGWASMDDYARDLGVFEKMPSSLLACFLPANVHRVDGGWRYGFIALQALAGILVLGKICVLMATSREARAFLCLCGLFAVVNFLPTIKIFLVHPSLINGRFGYQFMSFVIVATAVVLIDPWRPARGSMRPALRVLAPGVLAVVYAVVLQANLGAYYGGSLQVRRIQSALVREASEAPPGSLFVVFRVPHEYQGCPTIDRNLPRLVRPPLAREIIPAFPFVATQERLWHQQLVGGADSLASQRRVGQPVRFLVVQAMPPALHRLFGGPEPPRGKHAPVLIAPMDGAVLPCPGVQPGWEPEFRFRAPGSGRHFVLHLISGAQGGPVYPPAPERHLSFRMQVGRNALRTGDEVAYKLSSGDLSENPTADPWQALASSGFIPPLPVMWRVESIDERGESVGLSASARLVLITGPAQ